MRRVSSECPLNHPELVSASFCYIIPVEHLGHVIVNPCWVKLEFGIGFTHHAHLISTNPHAGRPTNRITSF